MSVTLTVQYESADLGNITMLWRVSERFQRLIMIVSQTVKHVEVKDYFRANNRYTVLSHVALFRFHFRIPSGKAGLAFKFKPLLAHEGFAA